MKYGWKSIGWLFFSRRQIWRKSHFSYLKTRQRLYNCSPLQVYSNFFAGLLETFHIYLSNVRSHNTSYYKSVKMLHRFLGHSWKDIVSRNLWHFPTFHWDCTSSHCHILCSYFFLFQKGFGNFTFPLLEQSHASSTEQTAEIWFFIRMRIK